MSPFNRKARTWLIPIVTPLVILGFMILLNLTNLGIQLENLTENWRFRLRGSSDSPASDKILVAGIGDYSLASKGRWESWTRDIHAEVCNALTLTPPKVLAYDFFFTEPSKNPEHDLAFADMLAFHPGSITGAVATRRHCTV